MPIIGAVSINKVFVEHYAGDSDPCRGSGCECHDTHAEHDAWFERDRLEFLRNPGAPPTHWDDETRERVVTSVNRARREFGRG